jgi:NADH dehydrogenase FAD-containing subunit
VAAEIATDAPDKKVTLLSKSDKLVDQFQSDRFSKKLADFFKSKNVEVIYNDAIDLTNIENYTPQKLTTKNGINIEFDAYLTCYGSSPQTQCIQNAAWLDDKGFIRVNQYFQILNTENIFVVGDCCNLNEMKLAYKANVHCPFVANNISELLKNNKAKLKEYVLDQKLASIVSLGRNQGAMKFGSFEMKGCVPTVFKSKNMFVSKYRSLLKQ